MNRYAAALALALLALVFATFQPALSGPFLLDDFLHIPKLAGNDGQVDSAQEVLELVGSGSGPSGRPLSYLSLLLDDNAWPSDPRGFKTTNLLLHLVNTLLVFALARAMVRMIGGESDHPKAEWIALAVSALWALNPMHLSPTMMVIQRMTLLAGTFSLLALLAYLHGRRLAPARPRGGYLWMVFGFGSALALGILCKEPAIMTVCYVIALEATVLGPRHPPRPPRWGLWAGVFLALPLLAIAAYFFLTLQHMEELLLKRNFDFLERLLTEGRVLIDYLRVIFLPSLASVGPYHDDYLVSRGLLSPPTTLIAWLVIATALSLALWRRRRWPLFSMAVLWFFLGHLLESTVLPIELYFEHRNYLPMLGPVFAACYWLLSLRRGHLRLVTAGLVVYTALIAGITFLAAKTYGNRALIASHWAAEHPGSMRAQVDAFKFWTEKGLPELAKQQMEVAIEHHPENAGLNLLRQVIQLCSDESLPKLGGQLSDLDRIVPNAEFEHGSLEAIEWLVKNRKTRSCRVSDDELRHLINLYLSNRRFYGNRGARAMIYHSLGELEVQSRDLNAAMQAFDNAYAARPTFFVALNQAVLLASAGLNKDAQRYLEVARSTPLATNLEWLWREQRIDDFTKIVAKFETSFDQARENHDATLQRGEEPPGPTRDAAGGHQRTGN